MPTKRKPRKVAPLETLVSANGKVRRRVPRQEDTYEVATPKGLRTRRVKRAPDPLLKKNPLNDLNPRQEAFAATVVPRLLAGEKGAIGKSARDLGYIGAVTGSQLMRHPAVLREIDLRLNEQLEKVDAETSWLLQRLGQVIDFDPRKVGRDLNAMDDDTAMALAQIEVEEEYGVAITGKDGEVTDVSAEPTGQVRKYKAYDKLAAIRMFLEFKKLLGGNRVELSGPGGTPLTMTVEGIDQQIMSVLEKIAARRQRELGAQA